MTVHHHPEPAAPAINHPEGREVDVLYLVDEYTVGGERRRLVLADYPGLGLTLFDLLAASDDDQHIAGAGFKNCAEAGDAADAHVAASLAAGRPAVETAEPPTDEQLRVLRAQARAVGGGAFEPPRTRAEARKWLRRSRRDLGGSFDAVRVAQELWEARFAGRRTRAREGATR